MTRISICNMALSYVGSQTVSTLVIDSNTDPSSSKSIKLCNLFFDIALEEILTRYRWKFAVTTVVPALDTTTPVSPWNYQFHKPTDCLRVLQLLYKDDEFTVEGDFILANSSSITIKYIKKIANFGEMNAYCLDAVAHNLAMKIAIPLRGTEGANLVQILDGFLEKRVIAEAKKTQAFEDNTADFQKTNLGAWVNAHHGQLLPKLILTPPSA